MVVPFCPRFLQAFLTSVLPLLTRPQARLLKQLTLAWLTGCCGKLVQAAKATRPRHRTSLGRFLTRSSWDAPTLLSILVLKILRRLRPVAGEVIYLLIDDTRLPKRARRMAGVKKIWDHVGKRFVRGHMVVTAAIVFRGITLPWRFHLWLPKRFCRQKGRKFLKLTGIAAEMIRTFQPPCGLKVRVLFDAFYLCKSVTAACDQRGFTWFSVASRNRLLEQDGRRRRIGQIGPGWIKSHGRRVRLRRARGWRWMSIAAVKGRLQKIGPVRVVFSKRPGDPWKKLLAIATNDLARPAREVVAIYERRWAIEVLFKELKGTFGLGAYQMQKQAGIERHLHLCGLAHLALTHHSLSAAGAQANEKNKDVLLPRFQERLEALRREIHEDNINQFVRRIRHPKIRRRVREQLLAA
jgi:hypothetical protein